MWVFDRNRKDEKTKVQKIVHTCADRNRKQQQNSQRPSECRMLRPHRRVYDPNPTQSLVKTICVCVKASITDNRGKMHKPTRVSQKHSLRKS
jgi:hypothetical protein